MLLVVVGFLYAGGLILLESAVLKMWGCKSISIAPPSRLSQPEEGDVAGRYSSQPFISHLRNRTNA